MTDLAALPMAPSTPSPDTATLVFAVVRAVLQLAGGLGIGVGTYSDSTLMIASGALVSIGSLVWSMAQKYRAKKKDHLGSVESAAVGVPRTPVMTAA